MFDVRKDVVYASSVSGVVNDGAPHVCRKGLRGGGREGVKMVVLIKALAAQPDCRRNPPRFA